MWYLQRYSDVRNARLNPFVHYVKYGAVEQRSPSLWFDPSWYLENTSDLDAKANPIAHFLLTAPAVAGSPTALFDSKWYIEQYADIREAGINPLVHYVSHGASEGRSPNMLFDTEWYLRQAGEGARHNPLLHYMTIGAAAGLSTHPLFDPNWYVRRYPDAAAAQMDPLTHYFAIGQHEGRGPHPSFDPVWYMGQSHAHGLQVKDALRHYLTIGLPQGVPGSSQFQPVSAAINAPVVNGVSQQAKPTILMVQGRPKADIDIHVYELSNTLAPAINTLTIRCLVDSAHLVEIYDIGARTPVRFDLLQQLDEIVEYLRAFNVVRANVHCTAQEFSIFEQINSVLNIPYDVTIYDYDLFAADRNLAGPNGSFVGEINISNIETFHSDGSAQDIVNKAGQLIVPSIDMSDRIQRIAGVDNIVVAPHLTGLPETQPRVPALKPGKCLNIAVLGTAEDCSGLSAINEVRQLVLECDAPIRIIMIGAPSSETSMANDDTALSVGEYVRGQLPEILDENDIHLIWYPIRIPEAFSYTLSEGLWSGLPLLVPNLGAFPERVAGRSWVFMADWDSTPVEWLSHFQAIRRSLLLHAKPDKVELSSRSYVKNFYKTEYRRFG
ncbi:hypothetical protein BC361_31730 [Ensifer sp. LC54]|nr:hypothetical protein BC361_31730 [Ensifer sp. LC54]OCP18687.1 hypothetical protein BC363_32050 [Ensifer sp. LC384]